MVVNEISDNCAMFSLKHRGAGKSSTYLFFLLHKTAHLASIVVFETNINLTIFIMDVRVKAALKSVQTLFGYKSFTWSEDLHT